MSAISSWDSKLVIQCEFVSFVIEMYKGYWSVYQTSQNLFSPQNTLFWLLIFCRKVINGHYILTTAKSHRIIFNRCIHKKKSHVNNLLNVSILIELYAYIWHAYFIAAISINHFSYFLAKTTSQPDETTQSTTQSVETTDNLGMM